MTLTRLHSKQSISDGIHAPISFTYANSTARLAASGFVSTDLYKFALQLDTGSVWYLSDIGTPAWTAVGSGSGGGSDLWTLSSNIVELLDDGYVLRVDELQVGEDSSVEVSRDISGNLTFKDLSNPAPITLSELQSEIMYNKQLDDLDGYMFLGESLPGTADSSATWRVRKIEFLGVAGEDIKITWAGGVSTFTQTWTDRGAFSYS